MRKSSFRGFTLVEMIIVVAMIAILAAVAIPGYRQSVIRTNRSEAPQALIDAAAKQEKAFARDYRYASSMTGLGYDSANVTTPGGQYQVSVVAADSTSFSMQAVPQGAQANDSDCGTYIIDNTGQKGISGSGTVDQCW